MDGFENLLEAEWVSVQRFVRFRMTSKKAWIISITRNKCNDYFRKKATQHEIPIDELTEKELSYGRHGISVVNMVRETLSLLGDRDKQILYLFDIHKNKFFQNHLHYTLINRYY